MPPPKDPADTPIDLWVAPVPAGPEDAEVPAPTPFVRPGYDPADTAAPVVPPPPPGRWDSPGMRALRVALLLGPPLGLIAAAVAYVLSQFESAAPPSAAAGRLVVLVVVDGLRGDLLDRYAPLFGPDGFERLKRDGAWLADAHLPYATTTAGPGHASFATGVPPSVHGVVADEWYERSSGRRVSCTANQLLVPTVADRLREGTGGRGRVVCVGQNETITLHAGQSADGCYTFDPGTRQFRTAGRLMAWAEEFNRDSPADRWAGRAWDRLAPQPLYDTLAGPGAAFPRALPKLQEGGYAAELLATPFANDLAWELAKRAVDTDQLGRGPAPDLLVLGLSATGEAGRRWGPDSHEFADHLARADRLLADLQAHLTAAVGPDRFTLVVAGTHGIAPLPEVAKGRFPAAGRLTPEVLTRLGSALDDVYGKATGPWVERVTFPWLDLNRQTLAGLRLSPDQSAGLTAYAAQWCGNRPGVATAFGRETLAGPPLADPVGRAVQLSFHPERSGDVCLVPRPYTVPVPTGTSSGSPHPYDTHVAVLAVGAGVTPGVRRERTNALDVTAMVCRPLGIEPPYAGR